MDKNKELTITVSMDIWIKAQKLAIVEKTPKFEYIAKLLEDIIHDEFNLKFGPDFF